MLLKSSEIAWRLTADAVGEWSLTDDCIAVVFRVVWQQLPNSLYVSANYDQLYRMFEQFSRGYYLGRLYVEPSDREAATMSQRQHERVNEQLYASDEGIDRLDRPLVMKVGATHLPVHGAPDVPADTLAIPEPLLDDAGVENPPTLSEVLLAKADRAKQLLELTAAR